MSQAAEMAAHDKKRLFIEMSGSIVPCSLTRWRSVRFYVLYTTLHILGLIGSPLLSQYGFNRDFYRDLYDIVF